MSPFFNSQIWDILNVLISLKNRNKNKVDSALMGSGLSRVPTHTRMT